MLFIIILNTADSDTDTVYLNAAAESHRPYSTERGNSIQNIYSCSFDPISLLRTIFHLTY